MRRTLVLSGAAAVIMGAALAAVILIEGSDSEPEANPGLPPATATVTRTTLVETKTVAGTLGYGDPTPVRAAAAGTLTWIARVGSIVTRGKALFKVDERPVVVLYGSLPLYRPLRSGVKGADVKQLESNLAALGYGSLTVDDTYTAATATAVRSWQADLGLSVTGTVQPGQVVFTPSAIRIADRLARVGDRIGGSPEGRPSVLSYTGTSRRVTVELEVADRPLAAKGRAVMVKVPGRRALKGRILKIGTVLQAQAASPDEGSAPATTTPAASDARTEVTVTITDQRALGSLDAAPVAVDFTSNRREHVLAVPIAALLALPNGGFGVQTVAGTRTRIVAVKTGIFAAGRVEVSGQGISAGVRVGVPK